MKPPARLDTFSYDLNQIYPSKPDGYHEASGSCSQRVVAQSRDLRNLDSFRWGAFVLSRQSCE
jgi:hypothetical protein